MVLRHISCLWLRYWFIYIPLIPAVISTLRRYGRLWLLIKVRAYSIIRAGIPWPVTLEGRRIALCYIYRLRFAGYRLGYADYIWWGYTLAARIISYRPYLCRAVHFYHIIMYTGSKVAGAGQVVYLYRVVGEVFYICGARA